jgi:cyclopropane fatty-acyl-phospholipid synthase-like methyltransferase
MDMDDIYRKIPPDKIPWNMEEPPEALVELLERGKVRPYKTVDFGCGTGNYAVYLAGMGFDVTGVDISPAAIRMAEETATKKGVNCRFIAADVSGDLSELEETFDFAYDWELLHHLFPEQRKKYIENVHTKLNEKGCYLSVCFSEEDPHFGGSGKYRETPIGTVLYFSTEDELKTLFEPYFHIDELSTVRISGKGDPHPAIRAFMRKK